MPVAPAGDASSAQARMKLARPHWMPILSIQGSWWWLLGRGMRLVESWPDLDAALELAAAEAARRLRNSARPNLESARSRARQL